MDVVALAQSGIDYAVATLGTAATEIHVQRLFRAVNDIVFCFDGDEAGRRAAWRALENTLPAMKGGRQALFLFLPEGEDPDSLVRTEGRHAFESRLDEAVPLSRFLFDHLISGVDVRTPEGGARFIDRFRPLVGRTPARRVSASAPNAGWRVVYRAGSCRSVSSPDRKLVRRAIER